MLLSIRLMCYNQEKYIAQALESIIMQKTNFKFEVVIGDDYSTDNTLRIIMNYKEKYPDLLSVLDRKFGDDYYRKRQRYGRLYNFVDIINNCKGKYVALLDGDDYWTDPYKLQKQVDLLERNQQFSMCFTNCSVVDENGSIINPEKLPDRMKKTLSQKDITFGTPPTMTVMFRNNLIKEFPEDAYKIINLDMFLSFLLTGYGDAAYIDKNTACYRMHYGGIWSMQEGEFKYLNNLKIRKLLLKYSGNKDWDIHVPQVNGYYRELLSYYVREKKYAKFLGTFLSYALFRIKYAKALWKIDSTV